MSFILKKTGEIETPPTTTISPFFNVIIGGGSIPNGGFTRIYRSEDSGENWSVRVAVGNGLSFFISSVGFIDRLTGLAGGANGTLWRTTNGGANWNQIGAPNNRIHPDADQNFYAIEAINNNTIYLSNSPTNSAGSNIFKTTNGGTLFTKVGVELDCQIRGLHLINAQTIIAVAASNFGSGDRILKSTDGGTSFSNVGVSSAALNTDFRSVSFNSNRGFSVGTNGAFWESSDFGDSWVDRTGDLPILTNNQLDALVIKFTPIDDVYIMGNYTDGIGILKSLDRGTSWTNITSNARVAQNGNGTLKSADWFDSNNGWLLMSDGEVLYTQNGGVTWDSFSIFNLNNGGNSEFETTLPPFNESLNVIRVTPQFIPPTTAVATTASAI